MYLIVNVKFLVVPLTWCYLRDPFQFRIFLGFGLGGRGLWAFQKRKPGQDIRFFGFPLFPGFHRFAVWLVRKSRCHTHWKKWQAFQHFCSTHNGWKAELGMCLHSYLLFSWKCIKDTHTVGRAIHSLPILTFCDVEKLKGCNKNKPNL